MGTAARRAAADAGLQTDVETTAAALRVLAVLFGELGITDELDHLAIFFNLGRQEHLEQGHPIALREDVVLVQMALKLVRIEGLDERGRDIDPVVPFVLLSLSVELLVEAEHVLRWVISVAANVEGLGIVVSGQHICYL